MSLYDRFVKKFAKGDENNMGVAWSIFLKSWIQANLGFLKKHEGDGKNIPSLRIMARGTQRDVKFMNKIKE